MDLDQEEPKPRFAHQFVYDPVSDEHYVGILRGRLFLSLLWGWMSVADPM